MYRPNRYFNEATLSLDANHWELMKQSQPKVPTITKFLTDIATTHYQSNKSALRVGMDAYVHSASFAKELNDAFATAGKDIAEDENDSPVVAVIDTLDGKPNIVDTIWDERPPLPKNPFRVHVSCIENAFDLNSTILVLISFSLPSDDDATCHFQPMKYAGMSVEDKVAKIREGMTEKKATLAVFGALDDIAYLFNVRCMGDIETCPVGIAYATVSHDEVTLYCDEEKVKPDDVAAHLQSANVIVKPYDHVVQDVQSHLASNTRNKVWLDNSRSNYAVSRVIPEANLVDAQNAVTPMKACKNSAEMEGMRQAHIVDGAAMAQFMAWLEHAIIVEGRSVSEVEIDLVLTGYRAQQPGFKEVSFPTIAGVGANGAIVHYRAAEGSDLLKYLDRNQPILIDSGGQYEYGTTDVTRTWHLGEATDTFKEMYTRVLKGNIGVDTMIFPGS